MSAFDGVVVGIVEELEDGAGLGRIKVSFPWMADRVESHWCRLARLMAGPDRGTFFMPEKGDEALVAFEHGDVRFPYIIGFLWNGVDKPPRGGITNSVRRIRTTSNHQLDFDDRGGNEAITITSHGGHVVTLDDARRKVEVASAGGHRVTLDDAASTITIRSSAGHAITMDATTITVRSSSNGTIVMAPGSIVLNQGKSITITSAGIAFG